MAEGPASVVCNDSGWDWDPDDEDETETDLELEFVEDTLTVDSAGARFSKFSQLSNELKAGPVSVSQFAAIEGQNQNYSPVFTVVSANLFFHKIKQQPCPTSTLEKLAAALQFPQPQYHVFSKEGNGAEIDILTCGSVFPPKLDNENEGKGQILNKNENISRYLCEMGDLKTIGIGNSLLCAAKASACSMMVHVLALQSNPLRSTLDIYEAGPFRYVNDLGFNLIHLFNSSGLNDGNETERMRSPTNSIAMLPSNSYSNSLRSLLSALPVTEEDLGQSAAVKVTTTASTSTSVSSFSFSFDCAPERKLSSPEVPKGKVKLIGGKYQVTGLIAVGSFSKVYLGKKAETEQMVAFKFEEPNTKNPQLNYEQHIMTTLESCLPSCPIPKILDFFNYEGHLIQVMPYIGPSLQAISKYFGPLKWPTVRFLASQMIHCLRYIHIRGIIHRDVKPANFLIDTNYKIWLIDFGLSKPYGGKDLAKLYTPGIIDESAIAFSKKKNPTGTARYSSPNTHKSEPQTCHDDLVSLGFSLVYLLKGKLPWSGADHENLSKVKAELTSDQSNLEILCGGEGVLEEAKLCLIRYFQIIDTWRPNRKFNYNALQDIFGQSTGHGNGSVDAEHRFEWEQ